MRKQLLLGIAVALLCSAQTWAADLTGKWTGEVKLPTGQAVPFIVELSQQGQVVTGKLAGINGAPDVQIMDGKLDKDLLTFWGVRRIANADVRFNYIGKVSADAIDFQILRADGSAAPLASHTLRAAGG
jgi:hypothetical protein